MKIKSKCLAMVLLFSLILSLCGCEKQSDPMKEDLESLKSSDSSGDAAEQKNNQLTNQLHIPDRLEMDILNDKGQCRYKINAEVDMPIETAPCVYQQRQVPFSKGEIKKRAKRVFDSGKFSYVKPLDCYTLDELNEEYKSLEKLKEKKDVEDKNYYWNRSNNIDFYRYYFKESEVKEYKEGEFSEGAEIAFYDEVMIMEGEIEGELYHLLAFTSEGHNYFKLCKRSCGYGLTQGGNYFGYEFKSNVIIENSDGVEDEDVIIDNYSSFEQECTQVLKKAYGEDVCNYSEEEAGKLALQYASLLVDTDMAIANTKWCLSDKGNDISFPEEDFSLNQITWEPNGYVFYLQRQYGNLSCNESNLWWREVTNANKETALKADPLGIVAEQESFRVQVTDDGVTFIDTIEPWYEITKTLSDSTSLMDFADIEELAQGYFEEMVKDEKENVRVREVVRICEVKLRYATVCYDGEYTLIPCWFFNESNGNDAGQSTVMVINAIDGSKVFIHKMD